ncbi:hypothetical protein CLI64_11075 [Nostoc sp. CENA543]|uniref:HK97 gp10 family phage protein n=1 Tax=Nostoc sp. CENA543 TaxID=1869241 RepID=UPI000CA31656|nr:HK97 gp10 family phage protein [Nostoc sp. CENA543]AUT00896.1 hypothetical protein CLI64_11075 [Nostoc sp. CENA543]
MLRYSVSTRGKIFEKDITLKVVQESIEATSDWALNRVRSETPVRTGNMRDGWTVTPQRRELFITNDVRYADIVSQRIGLYNRTIPQVEKHLRDELRRGYDAI